MPQENIRPGRNRYFHPLRRRHLRVAAQLHYVHGGVREEVAEQQGLKWYWRAGRRQWLAAHSLEM